MPECYDNNANLARMDWESFFFKLHTSVTGFLFPILTVKDKQIHTQIRTQTVGNFETLQLLWVIHLSARIKKTSALFQYVHGVAFTLERVVISDILAGADSITHFIY